MALKLSDKVNHEIDWMRKTPIAHRGLHKADAGIFENTLSAAKQAVEAGFSIEVDLQPSADTVPMVFHDYTLDRLTEKNGNIRDVERTTLYQIAIMGTSDRIPPLSALLDLVDGRVGLVLEMKGQLGADAGFLKAVANALEAYEGPVAIMSFNHWLLEDARKHAPHLPLGLTAKGGDENYDLHREIAEKCDIDFLSYSIKNLDCQFVQDFQKSGRSIISWTVKTLEDASKSAKYADQITFEGFTP